MAAYGRNPSGAFPRGVRRLDHIRELEIAAKKQWMAPEIDELKSGSEGGAKTSLLFDFPSREEALTRCCIVLA